MKKILFRKLLLDCLLFFLISLISVSVIIWVFQAVNFLDIMVEDGRDSGVYINYTLLNFPKIISKLIPFALFFSFYYVITKYEQNNELIIFWNFGIHKISLINFFLKFSIILMFFQLILTIYVVPKSQNLSRSLIKTSNVDFFDSFIKPKKFNDNIKGLTIYAEDKDGDGNLKNIYLKKDNNINEFQITIAKKGIFETINESKVLVLYDGQTINVLNNKVNNFSFSKSDFIVSQLETDVIVAYKVQETPTLKHISCLRSYFKKDLTLRKNNLGDRGHNCSLNNLDNIFQELYKRFIIPLYIPILISISLMLLMISKEESSYKKYKIMIFLLGLFMVIFSETTLKFVQDSFYGNLKITLLPFLIFIFLYSIYKIKLTNQYRNIK